MAPSIWRSGTGLTTALEATPERFDFFQAVRLLQQAGRHRVAVGESASWGAETVEFASEISFAFAPSDIKAIAQGTDPDRPARMVVRHLALAGAFGPLPAPFGERLLESGRRDAPQLLRFLDIFHHRLAALLFRAKQRSRPALRNQVPAAQPLGEATLALMGMATKGQRGRLNVPDETLLGFGGVLADRRRSSHGLERLLAQHFGVDVAVHQFAGRWLQLATQQWTVLGSTGRNKVLGVNTVLGDRAWNQVAGLRIEVGPLMRDAFERLLPGGSRHEAFKSLVFFATDRRFDIDVRLLPAPSAATPLQLRRSRLGYDSWLGRQGSAADQRPEAAAIRLRASENPSERQGPRA